MTWAVFHHMLGGIRHLFWDVGAGLHLPTARRMAWGTLLGAPALTLLFWIAIAFKP